MGGLLFNNELLNKQLAEANETNKRLENNLTLAISTPNIRTNPNTNLTQPRDEASHNTGATDNEKVILLHDSLCGKINETIMSREQVVTKKSLGT